MNISKYRLQLFASWEQFTAYLRQAQNALVGMGRNATERLSETFRPRVNDLRDLLASYHDAMAEANGKIAKRRSQLFAAWERFTASLRQAQDAFRGLGRKVVERPRATVRARVNNLRDLLASSQHAVALANGKMTKSRSQLFAARQKSKAHLRQAMSALAGLGRKLVEKPSRLQKALRAKENNLRKLLASSLDPIVVMDVGRRLVAANPKALDLFGVSETNLKKFTIDAFLSGNEGLFSGNGSPFKGRVEKHGECKIRRLDGSSRVAEYVFVANFAPYQHLCRFCNVRTAHIKSFAFSSGHGNNSNTAQLH